jgi:Leucine-rich repeat (LRR) protein
VCESLSTLILNRCSALRSVPPLTRFKHLTNLDLELCSQVSDLSGLVSITSIVTLNLHGLPHLTELWPLGSLSNLQDLDLSVYGPCHWNHGNPVAYSAFDITPLALCGQLVSLNLRCRNVEDLSPLATCTNLQKVILDYCPGLNRTTGLGSCLQLTDVSLHDSAVHCICDLIGCTRLTMLDLTRCWQIRLPLPGLPFYARGRIEGRSDVRSFMELLCKNNVPGRETNNISLREVRDMRPTTSLCVYHGHNYGP